MSDDARNGDPSPVRVRLHRHDAPAIVWILSFEPPWGQAARCDLEIGRSVARISLRGMPFGDEDGELLTALSVRDVAQLWHALALAHEGDVPIRIQPDGGGRAVDAVISSDDLRRGLEEAEASHGLGLRTSTTMPPVYLGQFWGPREFGKLDAMLSRLTRFRIVPDALITKARKPDSERNWAIVCAEDLARREQILDALRPLTEHRRGWVIDFPPGAGADETDEFLVRLVNMPVADRPFYLLVVGDFDSLSIESQYFLQSVAAVGRVAFDEPADYRAYAEKVIAQERTLTPAPGPGPTYISADRDDVNARNLVELVEPFAREEERLPPARELLAYGRADKGRVLRCLADTPQASVVFVSAHGFEHLTTRGNEPQAVFQDMYEFQGAPIFDDFQMPRPLGDRKGLLTADDVRTGRVAAGGVVILHACYSAGTVHRDTMPEWVHLRMPARVRPVRPFVSRLGRALLANPEGPVAVYGHVNRSHQYDYHDPNHRDGTSFTYQQYLELMVALTDGETLGLGRERCRQMTLQYMSQAMTLSHQIEALLTGSSSGGSFVYGPRKGVGAFERTFLQYSFATCNFRNYVILGDPMTRVRRTDG